MTMSACDECGAELKPGQIFRLCRGCLSSLGLHQATMDNMEEERPRTVDDAASGDDRGIADGDADMAAGGP